LVPGCGADGTSWEATAAGGGCSVGAGRGEWGWAAAREASDSEGGSEAAAEEEEEAVDGSRFLRCAARRLKTTTMFAASSESPELSESEGLSELSEPGLPRARARDLEGRGDAAAEAAGVATRKAASAARRMAALLVGCCRPWRGRLLEERRRRGFR
jgi:hypothetical protein